MNKVTYTKKGAVKVDDAVVGSIVPVPGQGFCYQHYKFGLKLSSALPSVEELMVRVEEYLQNLFSI